MVKINGTRILGYESGFDSMGRGLDEFAAAGEIAHQRKRQGEQDAQDRDSHTKALELAALRIKDLEEQLAARPAERLREQQSFDLGVEDRRADNRRLDTAVEQRTRALDMEGEDRLRRNTQEDEARAAIGPALQVLGGGNQASGGQSAPTGPLAPAPMQYPPMDGRGPMQGQQPVPGDLDGDGEIDEEEAAHLDETDRMLQGLAPVIGKLSQQDRAAILGPIMRSRASGLGSITAQRGLRYVDAMLEAGTIDEAQAQDAQAIFESGDPRAAAETLKALEGVHKANKQKAADVNLRTSAAAKTDEMLMSLPALGVVLTPEQEQMIEDLRQDLADPTIPTSKALQARDKIREIALGGASKGGRGSAEKHWTENPLVEKWAANGLTSAQMLAEARALGIPGVPAGATGGGMGGSGGGQVPPVPAADEPASAQEDPVQRAAGWAAKLEERYGRVPTHAEIKAEMLKEDAGRTRAQRIEAQGERLKRETGPGKVVGFVPSKETREFLKRTLGSIPKTAEEKQAALDKLDRLIDDSSGGYREKFQRARDLLASEPVQEQPEGS